MRISKNELAQMQERILNGSLNPLVSTPKKPSKYKNVRGVVDGITFDSMKEAKYYTQLKALKESGEVSWFIRQVPFQLPGKIKYVADFLVVYSDGRIEIVDVKGFMTTVFKMKAKLLEETYPFKLKVV